MRKDPALGAPTRISDRQERGFYVFWDATNWKRENRELLLNYDHLEQRHADAAHPA
jgi:CCR4-NOT transcription complex subunit 2